MANLKTRLAALEALTRKIKKFVRVWHVVLNDSDEQAAEIAELNQQGYKVRLFKVIE
ncbi:MAG: hypothetical protein Q7U66_07335 [Methylobacter sp.]|nr:hypothetical protein [Methylobacter sp.]